MVNDRQAQGSMARGKTAQSGMGACSMERGLGPGEGDTAGVQSELRPALEPMQEHGDYRVGEVLCRSTIAADAAQLTTSLHGPISGSARTAGLPWPLQGMSPHPGEWIARWTRYELRQLPLQRE